MIGTYNPDGIRVLSLPFINQLWYYVAMHESMHELTTVAKMYAYRRKISGTSEIKRVILHDVNLTSSSKKSDAMGRWLKLLLLPTKKGARKSS